MSAGVLASWLVNFLHNGMVVVMPAVIFVCTVLALVRLVSFSRRSPRHKRVYALGPDCK